MFERYTEKARRIVYHARTEAIEAASPTIETDHLLTGIIVHDYELLSSAISPTVLDSIREQASNRTSRAPRKSTVDLPLSNECKRVLAYSAEEADKLGDYHIGGEHLLLGLLREPRSVAGRILKEHRIELHALRTTLRKSAQQPRHTLMQRVRNLFGARSKAG
jgi:ATP-dependent Clp protease ATP-binding subunit ClpC